MTGHHYAECRRCGWQSAVVRAGEADDLAAAHDDRHHAARPTASVAYSATGTTR